MKTSDFYYELPQELIAQDPLEDRSASRLMTLDKTTGRVGHHVFRPDCSAAGWGRRLKLRCCF